MKKESGFKLKSGNKPSPTKMFGGLINVLRGKRGKGRLGGAVSMLGGPRIGPGGGGSMIGGALGMLGGRRRQTPGKPIAPNAMTGAIRPIASRVIRAAGARRRSGGGRKRSRFGGILSRFM